MERFEIKTKFIFKGSFYIFAESKEEAKRIVENDCGMSCGHIHSTLNNKTVDWIFNAVPRKQIKEAK